MIITSTKISSKDKQINDNIFFTCLYSVLFLFTFCTSTNSSFLKDSKLDYYNLNIHPTGIQPVVFLYAKNTIEEQEEKKISFVIDTGSNISLIRKDIFSPTKQRKVFRLKSISGESEKESFEVSLNLQDKNKNIISEKTIFYSFDLDPKFTFDGIIGNDILAKFHLFLELPQSIAIIIPSHEKIDLQGFRQIPIQFSEGHILLDIKIQKINCKFLLDTGAGISYLSSKKTEELKLKIGGKASFIDLGGNIVETNYHTGENLCVDENICQKKIDLLSGSAIETFLIKEDNLDGIIGQNWINQYSILIDYQHKNLYIRQR